MAGKRGGIHNYSVQEAHNVGLGQAGSIFVAGTDPVTSPTGSVFVAITFLENTTFNAGVTGLIAETKQLYPDSTGAGTDISTGGVVVDTETFPQGITIYGRWTGFRLATGKVIAYLG